MHTLNARHGTVLSCAALFMFFALFLGFAVSLHADALAYAAAEIGTSQSSVFGVLDLNTGAFSQVAILNNIFVEDLATSSNGTLYALTVPFVGGSNEFGTIDPSTGAITNIAPATGDLETMAFSSDGTLFGIAYASSGPEPLYTINPATGADSFIADLSGPVSTAANALRFRGDTAYTTSYTTPSGLYTIDLTSGAGTLIGNTGLNFDNVVGAFVNGQFVDIAETNQGDQIFWIDPTTGAATPGATVDNVYVFALATPEPSSATLLGIGFGCLLALRLALRRRPLGPGFGGLLRVLLGGH
jgi:hypothetical protein